eukprot:1144581-Pelagomonas_calceolata.AAC.9
MIQCTRGCFSFKEGVFPAIQGQNLPVVNADAPGAVVGQQTPTHKGLEPAAAGYPTSPYPFAPGDRTAMNSPYAAPAAAQEEPQSQVLISSIFLAPSRHAQARQD